MPQEEPTPRRIPKFATYQEEAEFWDTHDIGDYWDETEEVDVTVAQNLAETLPARHSDEAHTSTEEFNHDDNHHSRHTC